MESSKESLKAGWQRMLAAVAVFASRLGRHAEEDGADRPAPVIELASRARRRYPRGRAHFERRVAANVIPMWRHTGRPRLESR